MSLGLVIEMSPGADDCAATMGLVTLMSLGVAAGWQLSGDSVEALHQIASSPKRRSVKLPDGLFSTWSSGTIQSAN
jgi:hypothetical protein